MAIGTKLRELRKQNKLSVQYVAEQIGISPATIYRYENGSIEKIPSHVLTELARVLGTTPAQIIGWDDSVFSIPGIEPMPAMRSVPRLGTIACGEPILATENLSGQDEIPVGIDCDFTLICKGDSMIGARIHDGDIVCIRQQPTVENGQIAAVLIDDEATLKRVYIYPNQIVLSAENPAYAPMIYTDDNRHQIRILGLAVYFISRLH
ncbi:MAG: helix-turn-helix domain-containing protein [Clostridia bacterium]|nr:helix-turn-helix domain-containing protein [Clostridia bacterium]